MMNEIEAIREIHSVRSYKNKKIIKTIILMSILVTVIICISGCAGKSATAEKYKFSYWTEGCEAISELTDYVNAVTDSGSEDFIPDKDRIAVFDMDGTLMGETAPTYFDWVTYAYRVLDDPGYAGQATEEMIKTAEAIRAIPVNGIPKWLEAAHIRDNAKAFKGMTKEDFDEYILRFMEKPVEGFDNLVYGEMFYKPMVEIVNYLQENDFTVFIVSGTDTYVCRLLLQNVFDIPPYQIIGSEYGIRPDGQPTDNGLEYNMEAADNIIRDGTYALKNVKSNKVRTIFERIGQHPVLMFGNSSGDYSMAMITSANNKYKSRAFFVLCDDDLREYGNIEKAASLSEQAQKNGWHTISMKNDWKTIYGDAAVKTSR